jgi:hypothetical protein
MAISLLVSTMALLNPGVEGGASLMRMDSAGNILWSKRFFQPLGLVDDALMEPDGSILVAGYTEPTGGIFEPQTTPLLFLLKIGSRRRCALVQGLQQRTQTLAYA